MVIAPFSFTVNNLTHVDQVIALAPQSGVKETLSGLIECTDVRFIHPHHLDETTEPSYLLRGRK